MIFQFDARIREIESPEIWRTLLVPANFSFHHFHNILQAAFGWPNTHLYEFSPQGIGSGPAIGLTNDFTNDIDKNSKRFKLSHYFCRRGEQIIYTYDLGDRWEHLITLENIFNTPAKRATCLDGGGACPPEDCGGVRGFDNFKKSINDPSQAEHMSIREWAGLKKGQLWNTNEFNKKRTMRILEVM